jgi:hypothetical protein
MAEPAEKEVTRLLRRLASKGARLRLREGIWRIDGSGISSSASQPVVQQLRSRGLVADDGDGALAISAVGAAMVRRSLARADEFTAQHQERAVASLTDADGTRPIVVNADESPLSWLRRHHDRNGRPLIDADEFAAGERLRSDFTRGHLMPRVTANWSAAVANGGRSAGNAAADITDVAVQARRRVERAVEAVGPELGGLLVDFCCFLKGLEAIERERRWPARSAKVALRLALAALARHYGLGRQASGRRRSPGVLHWGAEDYRPTLD